MYILFLLMFATNASADNMIGTEKAEIQYRQAIEKQLSSEGYDFRLLDQFGTPYSLSDDNDQKNIMIASIDPVNPDKDQLKKFKKIQSRKKIKGLVLLSTKSELKREEIASLYPDQPVLMDDYHHVSRSFGFKNHGDFIVYQPKRKKIKDRGNVFSGSPAPVQYFSYDHSKFKDELIPAFRRACLNCHFQMQGFNYFKDLESVKSWRSMMLKSIKIKRMPPGADPYYTKLEPEYDHSDVAKVVTWLEAGAPFTAEERARYLEVVEQNKVLKKNQAKELISQMTKLMLFPEVKVEASGSDFYKHFHSTEPTKEDIYFRLFHVSVNENVAHHLALHHSPTPFPEVNSKGEPINEKDTMQLYGNNPIPIPGKVGDKPVSGYKFKDPNIIHIARKQGMQSSPAGTSYHIPKGSYLNFEIHFNPSGKEEISPIELSILPIQDETMKKKILRLSMTPDNGTVIARKKEKNSIVQMEYKLEQGIILKGYGLHMHYRGKSSKLYIQRPGEKEFLAVVFPTYQYKNQVTSVFRDGYDLPKNTIVRNEIIYDNSELNLTNPDPDIDVKIGTSVSRDENYLPRFIYMEKE